MDSGFGGSVAPAGSVSNLTASSFSSIVGEVAGGAVPPPDAFPPQLYQSQPQAYQQVRDKRNAETVVFWRVRGCTCDATLSIGLWNTQNASMSDRTRLMARTF